MSSDRCSRCGRDRPAGDPFPGPVDGPWLEEVCPECQSEEERREAAERIVAAIEREIERRREQGIEPDRHEAALVAYAMGLRAAAEAQAADGMHLRVALTGAFLTGHPLAVRLDGYRDLQRALGRRLKGPQWRTADLDAPPGTFESGGGFREAVPLVIARRDGADLIPWLSAALDDPWLARTAPGLELTPAGLDIDVYDLGVAVICAWFDVAAPRGAAPEDTARAIRRVVRQRAGDEGRSPLAAALEQIAVDAADAYGDAVAAEAPKGLQAAWLSRLAARADRPPDDRGRLLWVHPVLRTGDATADAARRLAPAFREEIDLDEGVFVPGIGWSAVAVPAGSTAADTPMRLTKLHWAYFAHYMEIDRGLLGVLNQPRWSEPAPLKRLEADAEDVFADYLRVMDARARLDSALSPLGGDELAIWDAIAKVQRFDAIVAAVERKLDVLQKLAVRRVEQADADRSRRIAKILGGLTMLTVVTVAVALIGAFLGSRSSEIGSIWWRAAIVAGAFAVGTLIYWLAFVRTMGPHGRAGAPGGSRWWTRGRSPR